MPKILIIDDSAVQRNIIAKFLTKAGHDIVGESSSGQDTIKLYKTLKPDVVILDIVLFDANGITILDELIHIDNNANIIMCSSTAIRSVIAESIQLGAKGFLIKPFKREVLLRTVNRALAMGV